MHHQFSARDIATLEKIRSNDLEGWEDLYDAYAPAMLSIICKLTNEKKKGEQFLVKLFTEDDFENFLAGLKSRLEFNLCTYAFTFAQKKLTAEGLEPDELTIAGLPIVLQFLYNKNRAEIMHREYKLIQPAYKPVKAYTWLPIFGVNIYA